MGRFFEVLYTDICRLKLSACFRCPAAAQMSDAPIPQTPTPGRLQPKSLFDPLQTNAHGERYSSTSESNCSQQIGVKP